MTREEAGCEWGRKGVGGGDRGTRTPNLGIANAALSQLSYIPTLDRGPNYSTGTDPEARSSGGRPARPIADRSGL